MNRVIDDARKRMPDLDELRGLNVMLRKGDSSVVDDRAKHYELELRKRGEGGKFHAQVFQIFDQGGGPADVVRQLKLSVEEAKRLHEEYLEMKKRHACLERSIIISLMR